MTNQQHQHRSPTSKQASRADRRQPSSFSRFIQAGLAFGLTYVLLSWAIDSGSLLEYTVALVLGALGVRHLIQAIHTRKEERG